MLLAGLGAPILPVRYANRIQPVIARPGRANMKQSAGQAGQALAGVMCHVLLSVSFQHGWGVT